MAARTGDGWWLSLLGSWELRHQHRHVHVTLRQQRLIAALALLPTKPRAALAGFLWPESLESRAAGNLRAAIWRIKHDLPGLLALEDEPLRLSHGVQTDISEFHNLVQSIDEAGWAYDPGQLDFFKNADLLPGWYDDWIVLEQQRIRQQKLTALQIMANRLLSLEATASALDVALVAVSIEPFSELSQSLLIQAQLASGNYAAASRQLHLFEALLESELGVEPSRLIQGILDERAAYDGVNRSTSAPDASPARRLDLPSSHL